VKKSELLKLLEDVPDNGDVLLWNGMVGDWMDIQRIAPSRMVKMTQQKMVELCRLEKCQDHRDWSYQLTAEEVADAKSAWRSNYKWEFNDYVTEDRIKAGDYKAKTVYLIDAKPRGETTWDHLGNISY